LLGFQVDDTLSTAKVTIRIIKANEIHYFSTLFW